MCVSITSKSEFVTPSIRLPRKSLIFIHKHIILKRIPVAVTALLCFANLNLKREHSACEVQRRIFFVFAFRRSFETSEHIIIIILRRNNYMTCACTPDHRIWVRNVRPKHMRNVFCVQTPAVVTSFRMGDRPGFSSAKYCHAYTHKCSNLTLILFPPP